MRDDLRDVRSNFAEAGRKNSDNSELHDYLELIRIHNLGRQLENICERFHGTREYRSLEGDVLLSCCRMLKPALQRAFIVSRSGDKSLISGRE